MGKDKNRQELIRYVSELSGAIHCYFFRVQCILIKMNMYFPTQGIMDVIMEL